MPAARLRRSRSAGARLRADLRAAPPHRPAHRHGGRRGRTGGRLHDRPGRRRGGRSRSCGRRSSSSARRTTRPAGAEPPALVREVVEARPGAGRGRRGLRPVLATLGARPAGGAGSRQPRAGVVRTFSKTWAMAASRLGYLIADPAVVAGCEAVVPAVPPVDADAGGRPRGPALPGGDGGAGGAGHRGAGPDGRRPGRAAGRDLAVGRQLHPLPAAPAREARRSGRPCSTASVLVRDCSGWDRARRLPAGDGRHAPEENDRFLRAPRRRRLAMTDTRDRRRASGRRRRRRSRSSLDVDGTGTVAVSTGLPFFDHMLEQLGRHGGFDLSVEADRRPRTSTPTTPSRTSASSSAQCLAEALGDKAGVRRFASLVAAARRGAGRGGARPVGPALPAYDVPFAPDTRRPRLAAVRPPAGRGVLAGLRHGRRRSPCTSGCARARTPTTSSRPPSRAWPGRCATRCGSRGRRSPRPRASL